MADIFDPLLAKPGTGDGDRRQPGGDWRAVLVGRDRPDEPVTHLVHRIDRSERDRHDDEGDHRDEGNGCGKGAIAVHSLEQPAIDGPARKADDDGREHRHHETVEEIYAGEQHQDEQPAGGRDRHDEGRARVGRLPEEPRLHGSVFSFTIAQLHL